MIISLSDLKKQKIRYLCTEILNEDFPIIWKVANLLEKISSSFSMVQLLRLYYRALKRDKIPALKFNKSNFYKKTISSAGKDDTYCTAWKVSVFGVILVRISTYSVPMRENTDQNISENGHFLRSVGELIKSLQLLMALRKVIVNLH